MKAHAKLVAYSSGALAGLLAVLPLSSNIYGKIGVGVAVALALGCGIERAIKNM